MEPSNTLENNNPSRQPHERDSTLESRLSTHCNESTPLLARQDGSHAGNRSTTERTSYSATHPSPQTTSEENKNESAGRKTRRWPSIVALVSLCVTVVAIIIGGFLVPSTVEQYAMQAVSIAPGRLTLDSFTATGLVARLQADITMDASRVKHKVTRDVGRFGTWIAREVESGESHLEALLPEYDNVVIGSATIPPVRLDVRNGHTTRVDVLVEVVPGTTEGVRRIANDLVRGNLSQTRVMGKVVMDIKSGIFSFGRQTISQILELPEHALPITPNYNITRLSVVQDRLPTGDNGLKADVVLRVANDYPFEVNIPPLGFTILAENCTPDEPKILLADSSTSTIHVTPKQDIFINVTGFIHRLPSAFLDACPGSQSSPLDNFLSKYTHGAHSTIYVRGSESPSTATPQWISELLSGIIVPVQLPSQTLGHSIEDFSMTDVHLSLPSLFADPNTPEAQPRVSAKAKVLVTLPEVVNFPVGVQRMRASSEVFYLGKKLGSLDLHKWNNVSSRPVPNSNSNYGNLEVIATVVDAPLRISDENVFGDFVKALLSSTKAITLDVKADVDVELDTAIGKIIAKDIPSQGQFPIQPMLGGGLGAFKPQVSEMKIAKTSRGSMTLSAVVNMTNPTNYSVDIPYAEVVMGVNGTDLGRAITKDVSMKPGLNTGVRMEAIWEPFRASGKRGEHAGKELLSQYISGMNATITIRTFNGTIPSQPALGIALSSLNFSMPMPRLGQPKEDPGEGDGDGDSKSPPHFIDSATMHLLSSTATFSLNSPLSDMTIYITFMNATAFYKNNTVGKILYYDDIPIPPGMSESPRLPVEWSLNSIGYEAVRKALGGTLKLGTRADCSVRIGEFEMDMWVHFDGIGAKVRV